MAKDDAGQLTKHTDEHSVGKLVSSLQEGAGELTDVTSVEGLASPVEIPVQSVAGHSTSAEEDYLKSSTEGPPSNMRNEAAPPLSLEELDSSCDDPPVLSDTVVNNFVETNNAGEGPWQEGEVIRQMPEETVSSIGASSLPDQELNGPKNETIERQRAVFDYITAPDFSMLDGMSGNPTAGIASGLVGPLVLKDRFNRWIDATAPIARELTSVAAAKAGLSVPGGIKSWLGNSWTAPSKGPARSPRTSPEDLAADTRPSSSKSLSASPVMKGMSAVHARNASTDGMANNLVLDTGAREVSSNPDTERGNQLMLELKQSLKIILGEVVKANGKPLGDGIYAITLFCGLLDQALAHGLKDGRPRWASWSSSKNPLSFLNLLEVLEQRLPAEPGPDNEDHRGSLGLSDVRSLNWVRTNAGRLRAWIRLSLNMGLLGARLRLVVEHVDLLQQWYEAWGLLRRDETSDELLSITMALNAVQANLSVGLGAGLDHQKYALFENLFTLDGSKSGNMLVGSLPENAYPVVEDEVSTITKAQNEKHMKYSKPRVVSMLGDEENGHCTAAPNPVEDIYLAVVDALSPPGSPYDSPRMSSAGSETAEPGEGIELRARVTSAGNDQEGLSKKLLSHADEDMRYLNTVQISSELDAGVEEAWEDNHSEGGSPDGDDSSERSMFAVESDDDGRRELSFSCVKLQQPVLNADAQVGYGHNDWADFEHENAQGLENFHTFFEETKVEKESNGLAVGLQATLAGSVHLDMSEESGEANEPVDDAKQLLEEAGGQVKGSGRPDLDEDEDDGFNADVDEKISMLSDLEDEECKSDVGVRPLPLFTNKSEDNALKDQSPDCQGSNLDEGVVEVQVDTEEGKVLENGGLSVAEPGHVNPFLPITLNAFTEETVQDKESQVVNTFSRMSSSSDNGEDLHFQAPAQESRIPMNLFGTFAGETSLLQPGEARSKPPLSYKPEQSGSSTLGLGPKAGQDFGVDGSEEEGFPEVKAAIKESTRRKGAIMRLGSKEAEELLQLDFTKMGRAILPPVKKGVVGAKLPGVETNGGDWGADDLGPDELSRYVETLEVKETYLDTILDMEDVLLDLDDNRGPRALHPSKSMFSTPVQKIDRDGGLSASTSGVAWGLGNRSFQLSANHLAEVAWVEVVGARQRRGGASLGERVVGVQEHTVYRILVRGGGGQEWEVERRYRDFVTLYQQLNRMFAANRSVTLPAPWDKVRAESRKLFGNTSPNVVELRSALIQVCLQSLLQAGPPLSTASPLLRFLFPTTWAVGTSGSTLLPRAASEDIRSTGTQMSLEEFGSEPAFSPRSDTTSVITEAEVESNSGVQSVFGKTIRLILQVHKRKPLAQQMHVQHHACAGCYRQLDISVGLFPGLAQSLGLGGPRWCEYSGQLFCSSCHLNETAVIPAYVLQRWDFGLRPVSQLAKAYLDSIYDKPMLCVSAVNPYLYFRVPILAHLRETRKRLSKMLACIRCPSRSRIQSMVGSRRYLLENNDFFALRDLTDLSKGAFAGLPAYMNSLSEKLTSHIKRECSLCHEMGTPCGAAELCKDPLDIIYPFQEDGIVRCATCRLPFHKLCFTVCKSCPSCSGGQSVHNLDQSRPHEIAANASNTCKGLIPHDSSVYASLPPDDISVQAEPSSRLKKKKSSFFAGMLTSKDSSSKETLPRRQDSVVLNMSALSGPLEL